ncbi:MAG: c-type cytochrome [Pseudomonadota bacterium]
MKKSHWYAAGLVSLLAMAGTAPQAFADDEITRGQLMAASCKTCHGEAAGRHGVPDLARLSPDVIVSQMKAFRDGEREATIMDRHAKGYSDAEVESMAGYFAKF